MEFANHVIFIAGALLLVSALASLISARVGMPLLLLFLIIGMLLGEQGLGGVKFDNPQTAYLVGTVALAIILFDGGLRTDVQTFRVGLRPAVTLATLGVAITAFVTGAFAVWWLGLGWMEGLLLGAIVGSTDAAAVFSLLNSRGLEIKQRVGATLEIESGSNDPMAVFLTVVLVEAIAAGRGHLGIDLLGLFVVQMGLGAGIGVAGGLVMRTLLNRLQLSAGLYPLTALAGALTVFGLAAILGGSGFLAVYLTGVVLGNRALQGGHNIRRFHDAMAWLAQIIMFLVLGLLVTPSNLLEVAPQAVALAAVLIFLARPLAVGLCLWPFHFPLREQAFIAWVGLRGAVPIVLALFPFLAGLPDALLLFDVTFFVVLVSLMLQGWTVAPAARWLKLEVPTAARAIQRVELDVPGQAGLELVGYRLDEGAAALGRPLEDLSIPAGARLAAIIRDSRIVFPEARETLQAGDYAYLMAGQADLHALDSLFVAVSGEAENANRRFFGEFTLDGGAHLGDIADVYGLRIPAEVRGLSAGDYLRQAFKGRQVVGDNAMLGDVQLVVREIEGGEVSKVGLKLSRPR